MTDVPRSDYELTPEPAPEPDRFQIEEEIFEMFKRSGKLPQRVYTMNVTNQMPSPDYAASILKAIATMPLDVAYQLKPDTLDWLVESAPYVTSPSQTLGSMYEAAFAIIDKTNDYEFDDIKPLIDPFAVISFRWDCFENLEKNPADAFMRIGNSLKLKNINPAPWRIYNEAFAGLKDDDHYTQALLDFNTMSLNSYRHALQTVMGTDDEGTFLQSFQDVMHDNYSVSDIITLIRKERNDYLKIAWSIELIVSPIALVHHIVTNS